MRVESQVSLLCTKTQEVMFKSSKKNKFHTATGKPAFWTKDLISYVRDWKSKTDKEHLLEETHKLLTHNFSELVGELLDHNDFDKLRDLIEEGNLHILQGISSYRFKEITPSNQSYQMVDEESSFLQAVFNKLSVEYDITLHKMNVSLDAKLDEIKVDRSRLLTEALKNILSHILFRTFWVDTIHVSLIERDGEVVLQIKDEGIYSESRQYLFNKQDKPCGYLNDASAYINQLEGKLVVHSHISGVNIYLIQLTNIISH